VFIEPSCTKIAAFFERMRWPSGVDKNVLDVPHLALLFLQPNDDGNLFPPMVEVFCLPPSAVSAS
jgi:hypothetical protein